MKKFGPYKGISNNNTNNTRPVKENPANNAIPSAPNKGEEENRTSSVYVHKASLDELKRRYTSYLEKHKQLSESLDNDEE